MQSKADQSQLETMQKDMKTMEVLSKKISDVRTTMARKLDTKKAESMMVSFVPKEELRLQMKRMHQKLRAEINGVDSEAPGFALQGKGYFSEESEHHSHPDGSTCQQCKQRKFTIGQTNLFHTHDCAKGIKEKASKDSKQKLKLPELKRGSKGTRKSQLDQEGTLIEFADPGMSQWSTGLLDASLPAPSRNQGDAKDTEATPKLKQKTRPKTVENKTAGIDKQLAESKHSASAQALQRPHTMSVEVHVENAARVDWRSKEAAYEKAYYEAKGEDETSKAEDESVKVILGTDGNPAALQLKPKEFGKDI